MTVKEIVYSTREKHEQNLARVRAWRDACVKAKTIEDERIACADDEIAELEKLLREELQRTEAEQTTAGRNADESRMISPWFFLEEQEWPHL